MVDSSLYIGLMSGTSLDGIDAVLADFQDGFRFLAHHYQPWPEQLKMALRELAQGNNESIDILGQLDQQVARHFADAARQLLKHAGIKTDCVAAIGSHGQTIRHRPAASHPFTLQIGDPNRIAEETGLTVVGDFRRRDMAAGGQGAPLVPAFHQALFQTPQENRAILNLGGIANITLLPSDQSAPIVGMDTGPANTLLDQWCRQQQGNDHDDNGAWAASGAPQAHLLRYMLDDSFFSQPGPKSTGPEHFSLQWLERQLLACPVECACDVQATLVELTVESVAMALEQANPPIQRLIVCGGGVRNGYLMRRLADRLGTIPVESSEDHGVDPQQIEAGAFAWLAWRTLHGKSGNLPSVTGARGERVLGAIFPAQR